VTHINSRNKSADNKTKNSNSQHLFQNLGAPVQGLLATKIHCQLLQYC